MIGQRDPVAYAHGEAYLLHVVERVPAEGRGKAAQFIPIRCIFFNKLTKDDKLLLAYDAFVLGQVLGRDTAVGKLKMLRLAGS
jgi:hypothetical protein